MKIKIDLLERYKQMVADKKICCANCIHSSTFKIINGENTKSADCDHTSCLTIRRKDKLPIGWKPRSNFAYANWKLGTLYNLENELFEI